jgi:hypothetical protein
MSRQSNTAGKLANRRLTARSAHLRGELPEPLATLALEISHELRRIAREPRREQSTGQGRSTSI